MALKDEQILQINLMNWFKHEYPQFAEDIHHFANERKCSYQEGRTLKKMGVTKGISDIFLAVPTFESNRTLFHGLWLELKTEKGRATHEQMEFIHNKNQRGYYAVVTWGLEAAKEIIKVYLRDIKD